MSKNITQVKRCVCGNHWKTGRLIHLQILDYDNELLKCGGRNFFPLLESQPALTDRWNGNFPFRCIQYLPSTQLISQTHTHTHTPDTVLIQWIIYLSIINICFRFWFGKKIRYLPRSQMQRSYSTLNFYIVLLMQTKLEALKIDAAT